MAHPATVDVESLIHRYGARTALDSVDFEVEEATILGLLGPNGSGKTTLFSILATLITPTGGAARIAGADVVKDRRRLRATLGIVFQNPSLDSQLTVCENLICQGNLYGLSGKALQDRVHQVLRLFDVADRASDRVRMLSGGLRRRVELAKAMLHRPRVLLLDEPSTGLDPTTRANVMDYLCQLRDEQKVTCLITTHIMEEADRCDRIVILDDGTVVAQGTPTTLKENIGAEVLTLGTREPSTLAAKVSQRFGLNVEILEDTVRIERNCGHELVPELIEAFPGEIDSVTVGKPTLEDVFVHHTGHHFKRETDEMPEGANKIDD